MRHMPDEVDRLPPGDPLEAALDYVRRGLKVVPLHTPIEIAGEFRCSCREWPCPHQIGKHPRPGYGLRHACETEAAVRDAWSRWPDANIGVVVPEGFVVVDLDGPEAVEWWNQRTGIHTRTTITGSGGQHKWLRLPDGVAVRGRPRPVKFDGTHREVMVLTPDNGYLVMPPSRHGGSGAFYRWENGVGASAMAPADLVAEIASPGLREASEEEVSTELMRQAAGRVAGQQRDTLMLRYLGALHRLSPGASALLEAAREMDRQFGESLGEAKLRQHVATITGKPGGEALPPMGLAARLAPTGDWGDGPFRLQVEKTNPKTWLLHFPEGVVRLPSAALASWQRITIAHIEQLECSPRWNPGRAEPWTGANGRHDRLEQAMTPEDHLEAPPEETIAGRVLAILRDFVGQPPEDPGDSQAQAAQLDYGAAWWDLSRGRVVFKFATLCAHYNRKGGSAERLTTSQLRMGLELVGGEVARRVDLPPQDGRRQRLRLSWVPIEALEE